MKVVICYNARSLGTSRKNTVTERGSGFDGQGTPRLFRKNRIQESPVALGEVLSAAVNYLEFRPHSLRVKRPFASATPVYALTDGLLDKGEPAG